MLTKGMYVADRYEILDKVGAGGMSDVYKAKDHILSREVAVKVLKQEFAEDVTFVTKFRTEAQSAAGLEHPNIVNIYDVGSDNGVYYIVMEYVEGITLKTYIEKKGQLNFKEAISIAIQVGRGIEAAHNKGIIHRDIKPQNIIISTEGKVKVTDFGIARAVTSNTINADVMGSVHYSSPEQARNGYVDGKSDIYSLGIVMYEMVTGRVPFDGDTTVAVAIQHLQEEMVAPSAYAPELPISLEKIILKATMKSPDRRYENIEDLLMDLKKSLVSPNEDFVTILDADDADKTKIITEDELEQIQKETEPLESDEEDEDDEGMVNPKMEKAINIMGIAAAVIIIGIIVYLIGSFFGLFNFGSNKDDKKTETESEQVEMPDLLGMTEDEATDALNELGLGIKVVGTASSDEYDEGQVMDQSVDEGEKVAANTTIKVTISSGKGSISIPNVVGMDETAAINALTDAGFKYSRDYSTSSDVAQGKVISQNPSASSTGKKGDTITIVVSQGKESVKVPNVVGMTQENAKSTLQTSGLGVGSVSTDYSDTVAEGCVISQGTGAGSYVDAGSSVTLVVSLGSKTTYYKYSRSIQNSGTTEMTVTLKDSTGKTLYNGKIPAGQQLTINANNITTSSGTIHYSVDGNESSKPEDVGFDKQ